MLYQAPAVAARSLGLVARAGFTAVELIVVIGIALSLAALSVPAVLPSIRHGQVHAAVNDLTRCWREAAQMAIVTPVPAGECPPHFGIAVRQVAGQRVDVGVIFDNVATGSPKYFMQGQVPGDASTYSPGGAPIVFARLNRNIVMATATVDAPTPSTADKTIIVYAQYGTGLPISADDVAANRGQVAAPISVGVSSDQALASSICPMVMLQTLDYDAANHRGFACSFALYHAGFTAAKEL
jgi:Tfp pilus assembly protein FimT